MPKGAVMIIFNKLNASMSVSSSYFCLYYNGKTWDMQNKSFGKFNHVFKRSTRLSLAVCLKSIKKTVTLCHRFSLFCLALLSYFFHPRFNNGLVSQVVMIQHVKIIVKFIDQWNACWNVDAHDFIL